MFSASIHISFIFFILNRIKNRRSWLSKRQFFGCSENWSRWSVYIKHIDCAYSIRDGKMSPLGSMRSMAERRNYKRFIKGELLIMWTIWHCKIIISFLIQSNNWSESSFGKRGKSRIQSHSLRSENGKFSLP